MTENQAATFGKAIGNLTRQKILEFCCCEEKSVSDIAAWAKVTQPTATHHLAILLEARLISRRKEGKMVFYQVNQDSVVACCGKILVSIAPDKKEAHKRFGCCD